ncbi:MAG: 50S ribosomal protein L6 [Legionella sp.]|nr:50S ribosomal protein L6 [Legionella sp.]
MSRVAKASISLPSQVELVVNQGTVNVKGPKGSLTHTYNKLVDIVQHAEEKKITFQPLGNNPNGWTQAGTARALLNNMITGVTTGFSRTLELVGVGYRAQVAGSKLTLSLGYSHPIEYTLPEGVTAETPNVTTVILRSINKQLLGQVAAEVRAYRPPEPYKGKGVKYNNEVIQRKEAKKK